MGKICRKCEISPQLSFKHAKMVFYYYYFEYFHALYLHVSRVPARIASKGLFNKMSELITQPLFVL